MSSDEDGFGYGSDDVEDIDDLLEDDASDGDDDLRMHVDETDDGDDDDDRGMSHARKKSYEVSYKVMSEEQLGKRIDKEARQIAGFIGFNASHAKLLLRLFRWHGETLVERFTEDSEKALEAAGVPADNRALVVEPAPAGFACILCCSEGPGIDRAFLSCGHAVCVDCFRYYVAEKVREGLAWWNIRCPGNPECRLVVDESSVEKLDNTSNKSVHAKFRRLVVQSYVDASSALVWCPAPECIFAAECGVRVSELTRIVPTVHCQCGNVFCFGCQQPDHQPTICPLVKKWQIKCRDDSETAHWMRANTKDCPTCKAVIEKNGGCNHMTCRKCRYEFCWVCMGDWAKHKREYYNCSRFDEGSEEVTDKDESRKQLERYLFYYERYDAHLQSLKLDKETYTKVEKKMREMQETLNMNWIEVQFLADAYEALRASRNTLMWSYVLSYYLKRNNYAHILEDNQKDLQTAVEELSEVFEQPVETIAEERIKLMDKKAYVASRRITVLEFTQNCMDEGLWEYNVSVN